MNLLKIARDGLRAGPSVLDAYMSNRLPWIKIPTYYYDYKQVQLPLTPDECSSFFDSTIPIFVNEPVNEFTNAAVGLRLNEAFLAVGVGVIAVGEPESFTLSGLAMDTLADGSATPLLQALAVGLTDPFLGAVDTAPGDLPVGVTGVPGTFNWGGPTWKIIDKFIRNYRLQIVLNNRFEVTNESVFDLGMVWTFPANVGTSSSRIAAKPYIQGVNQVLSGKNIGTTFLPANIVIENDLPFCLPPPNPQVSYGHPDVMGVVANRIYSFPQPLLLVPGLRFQMDFIQAHPDTEPTICDLATVNAGSYAPELTGVIDAACGLGGTTIPGGSIHLGLVLKGFALQPSAALHYLQSYLWKGSVIAEALSESQEYSPWLGRLQQFDPTKKLLSTLGKKPEPAVPWDG
jgi:hypothetical protein